MAGTLAPVLIPAPLSFQLGLHGLVSPSAVARRAVFVLPSLSSAPTGTEQHDFVQAQDSSPLFGAAGHTELLLSFAVRFIIVDCGASQ